MSSLDNFPNNAVNMTRNSNVQICYRKLKNQLTNLVTPYILTIKD